MPRVQLPAVTPKHKAWNKGRIIGQKRPLLPKQVWAIRARLELSGYLRDLALFNVAIDSKLRGCDLVKLAVADLVKDDRVRERVSMSPRAKPSKRLYARLPKMLVSMDRSLLEKLLRIPASRLATTHSRSNTATC